jgi:hypothetical protein
MVMQQFARQKFASFNLKVPMNWQEPQGDAADHYSRAFKPEEKTSIPAMGTPPLFQPASLNKYHTDTQKMHHAKIGEFIDGMCSAICSAWSTWQNAAALTGVVINGPTAMGGQIVGPPMTPLILKDAPKSTPMLLKYSNAIAQVIGMGWDTFIATVKVTGLPFFPSHVMVTAPIAPPVANVPHTFAQLFHLPTSIEPMLMKTQKIAQLGDPNAPFHEELFESIAHAFDQCFQVWKTTTMVTNVMGTGPVPTFAPPYVPGGPVVGGVGNMVPGGFK